MSYINKENKLLAKYACEQVFKWDFSDVKDVKWTYAGQMVITFQKSVFWEKESIELEKLRALYNMPWASREQINEVIKKKLYVAHCNGEISIYNQKRWKEYL